MGGGGVKGMGANGPVDLIAFTELEIIKKLQTELHMLRARDGSGSEYGSRKQSCACLWSKGAVRREGHILLQSLAYAHPDRARCLQLKPPCSQFKCTVY